MEKAHRGAFFSIVDQAGLAHTVPASSGSIGRGTFFAGHCVFQPFAYIKTPAPARLIGHFASVRRAGAGV